TAADTLHALRALPIVEVACAWDAQGQFFAAYQPALAVPCPASPPGNVDRSTFRSIELGQPITVGSRVAGSLSIRANLSNVTSQLRAQAFATLLALLLGAISAVLFARR